MWRDGTEGCFRLWRPVFEYWTHPIIGKDNLIYTLSILDLVSASKICPFFPFLMANYGGLYHCVSLYLKMPQGFNKYFAHRKFQH